MNEETLNVSYESMIQEYKDLVTMLTDERIRLTCVLKAANGQMTAYKEHIKSQDARIESLEYSLNSKNN